MEYSNLTTTNATLFGNSSDFNTTPLPPPAYLVWIYGLLLVTAINLCSLLGIVVNPLSKKHSYSTVLLFMVSLAVGVLAGSSLLFLFAGALEIDTAEWEVRENYIIKVTIALATVFLFFNFEQILKLILAKLLERRRAKAEAACPCKQNGSQAVVERTNNIGNVSVTRETAPMLPGQCRCSSNVEAESPPGLKMKKLSSRAENDISFPALPVSTMTHHHPRQRGSAVPGISIGLSAGTLKAGNGSDSSEAADDNEVFESPRDHPVTPTARESVRRAVSIPRKESVANFKASSLSEVQPVAWMIVFGDGIHNFVDGLSIGAAMTRSFAEGLSISLAVLAEELPHELGDLAVLLRAGLSLRQALSFNFLSACLCYLGFIIGVLIGESPNANTVIFAIAAGLFLYIALTDLLPELSPESNPEGQLVTSEHKKGHHPNRALTDSQVEVIRKHSSVAHLCSHLAIADLGMLLGYFTILTLAVYSEEIASAVEN